MTGHGRGFVWLIVVLSVLLGAVVLGGAFIVFREREHAELARRLAEGARLRLAEERRKAAEAERQAAAARRGSETEGGETTGTELAWLKGRHAWVVTRTRPTKDYCAILRRAGVVVRCGYATNKVKLHVLILRCADLSEARGRALLGYLGLNLRINNWQHENACGRYHEITIYLND
jgi:hypothetical protein